jgi:hypothetical protein
VVLTSHVCKLLAAALEVIAVLGLDGILDGAGHGIIGTENGALHKLDLARHTALEATSCSNGTAGLLSLSPGGGRARFASRIWGGRPLWCTVLGTRAVAASGRVDVGAIVSLSRVLCGPVAHICL